MAYSPRLHPHLSSSFSTLFDNKPQQTTRTFLSPSCLLLPSPSPSPFPPISTLRLSTNPIIFPIRPAASAAAAHLSLHEPVLSELTSSPSAAADGEKVAAPEPNSLKFKPKSHIWVNPNSPRAAQIRHKSYVSRHAYLVSLADKINYSDSTASPDLVDSVLTSLGENIVEQDAVIVLNHLKNPQSALSALRFFLSNTKSCKEVVLYNVTLKVMKTRQDLNGAEKLFDEMIFRGVKPDNVTFSTLISCAGYSGSPEEAVVWFERMHQFGCQPDDFTYSAVIDAYGRVGEVDKATSLYDRARSENRRLDSVTFGTLIKVYGQSGNYDGCLNIYEEMKALKIKPNIGVYNSLLEAMGRAKRPWQVMTFYKELNDSGCVPNRNTYTSLLRAFSKSRYGLEAMKVYRKMKEKGLQLDGIMYNTVLAMCADVGFNMEAAEIFQDMKGTEDCQPDSWTYSSMIKIHSCTGQVQEAEALLNEMLQAGYEPNIFILTSLIQCYGKARQTDAVVRTFNQVFELGINHDDRFCGCLLNVMTQVPIEDLGKLVGCLERANETLAYVVKLLVEKDDNLGAFREATEQLIDTISPDVKRAYCNCLIDLCINLNLLERACELLELGLSREIYFNLQSQTPTQWSLNLRTLSLGAALTALHIWINDLSRAFEKGDDLPPVFGINTGHGKHKFSDKGLAEVVESHLKELNSPFHEDSGNAAWFLTTKSAMKTWLNSRKPSSPVLVST